MDFKQYKGKNILAWLFFNANYEDPYGGVNRVCYVYPRVLMKGTDYDLVDSADFPKLGVSKSGFRAVIVPKISILILVL